jgi:hypothetical protein
VLTFFAWLYFIQDHDDFLVLFFRIEVQQLASTCFVLGDRSVICGELKALARLYFVIDDIHMFVLFSSAFSFLMHCWLMLPFFFL